MSLRRPFIPLVLCLGMLVIPLLALRGSRTGAATTVSSSAPRTFAERASRSEGLRSFDRADLVDPTTTAEPTLQVAGAAPVAPAAAPPVRAASPAVHHTATPAPTPAAAPAPRPAPAPAPAPRPSQTGPASWYGAPAGTCAHQTLPFGTVVTVTDLSNGRSTTCTVEDRGPYEGGRIIDLSEATFSQLAPPSSGVIEVRISW